MIQFTRLRVAGFKSFVDPTDLLIDPGMTGIVGPNGCGKSNLVEALRWVMGETSAKQMRGGEMDDVIFSGTSHRPARNLAEVSLTLDNARRSAPAQFNDLTEIEVTRRIERGQGSIYRCNGKDVRAKDVHLLFADAATGARSTAMVSQGRVGALIGAKPTQRRALLEEAAGIAGLHSRRHEAELRLRAAENNLTRLEDVLAALDAQLASLRRQAKQAQRYRDLSEQIRKAEATVLFLRWAAATEGLDAARTRLREVDHAVAALTGEAAAASRDQALAAHALPPLREAEAAAAAALQRLIVAREQVDSESRRLDSARVQAESRLRQIAEDVERERARAHDAEEALERLEEEAQALDLAAEGEEETEAEAAERLDLISQEVEEQEEHLARLTEQVASDEAARTAATRRVEETAVRADRLAARLAEAEAALSLARAAAEDDTERLLCREALDEAALSLEEARLQAEEAEEAVVTTRDAAEQARETFQARSAHRAGLAAEVAALTAILAEGLGAGAWSPALDALVVDAGAELALGAALGEDLSAPIEAAAPMLWQSLPPLTAPPALPPGVVPLAERVQAPPALARRLSQIGVVETAERGEALRHDLQPGQRLVSPEGDLWRWDGFTVRAGAPSPAAVRLHHRTRLRALEEDLAQAQAAQESAQAEAERTKTQAEQAQASATAARSRVRMAEQALAKAREAEAEAARRHATADSRLATARQQADHAAADLAEARAEAQAARDAREALSSDSGAARATLEGQRATLATVRATLVEARSTLDRLRRDRDDRRRRREQIAADRASWHKRREGSAAQRAELDRRHAEVREELRDLSERPGELAAQRDDILERIEQAEERRQQAADSLAEAEARQSDSDRALKDCEKRLAVAREDRVRAESAVEQGEQASRAFAVAIAERLDTTPLQARSLAGLGEDGAAPPSLEEVERRLQQVTREREAMGPVNLRAEQEAAELDTQRSTLGLEHQDLTAAIARLRQGIAELNREGRQRLLASFEQVDSHFRRLFVRLFGGGRAHLALTESDDPLDAGLEIFASPPGKRLQSLSLLSGGEQAMTAIALLFAVFLVNPAPICVLDEVDAPLDDANVDRFCTLLTELTRAAEESQVGTRFLVVTHHRMTMARMDRLYGVTMGERGVSKLVSVDLRQAETLVETA